MKHVMGNILLGLFYSSIIAVLVILVLLALGYTVKSIKQLKEGNFVPLMNIASFIFFITLFYCMGAYMPESIKGTLK